jgi:hypothetical protein
VTLGELLAGEAAELPGVEAGTLGDGAITWSRGGRTFAVLSAAATTAEFDLDPLVAEAAARTPDVSASARGGGWVAFTPPAVDDHAADRAVAWFASAHRRSAPRD